MYLPPLFRTQIVPKELLRVRNRTQIRVLSGFMYLFTGYVSHSRFHSITYIQFCKYFLFILVFFHHFFLVSFHAFSSFSFTFAAAGSFTAAAFHPQQKTAEIFSTSTVFSVFSYIRYTWCVFGVFVSILRDTRPFYCSAAACFSLCIRYLRYGANKTPNPRL